MAVCFVSCKARKAREGRRAQPRRHRKHASMDRFVFRAGRRRMQRAPGGGLRVCCRKGVLRNPVYGSRILGLFSLSCTTQNRKQIHMCIYDRTIHSLNRTTVSGGNGNTDTGHEKWGSGSETLKQEGGENEKNTTGVSAALCSATEETNTAGEGGGGGVLVSPRFVNCDIL